MPRRALKDIFTPSPTLIEARERAIIDPGKLIQSTKYGFKVPEEKSGRLLPFQFRWGQQQAYRIFQEERDKGKPIRLWFLKSRRVGLTSMFAALGLIDCWSQPNRKVGIIAHNEHRAKEILQMCKLYYKHMPPFLKVPLSKDAIYGLKFKDYDSEIIIGTCNEPDKVRGGGLHWAHLSEPAHYKRMFRKTMLEISTTVAPEAGTAIILETTGAGRGSSCHSHWLAATEGQNIYRPVFLPWVKDPTCALPFEDSRHKDVIIGEMAEIEPRLAEKGRFFNLTPEQMHWFYRHAYLYRCEQDYEYLCREFPMDEEEAWDAEGISFFGDNEIAKMSARLEKPILFSFANRFINSTFSKFTDLQRVEKLDDTNSNLHIKLWASPDPHRRYVIGADCSLGEAGGTYSVGYVIDIQSREMMCAYRGRMRPDEHAFVMASIGTIYNTAIVAPEINPGGGGMQVLNDLQRLGYYNIYIWRLRDDKRGIILSQKLGWLTNVMTRPLMLNELRKMFVDAALDRFHDPGIFRDKTLLTEMRTFQKDHETGRIEAAEDAFDDCIMALAIAHRVAADEVHGGNLDLYASYESAQNKSPFTELLRHCEEIDNGTDPTNAIQTLISGDLELHNDRIQFYD